MATVNPNIITHRSITRYQAGKLIIDQMDKVATEFALTIYVNEIELATVVCSPDYMEDLVIGFLASEGVIRSIDQIKDLHIHMRKGAAYVEVADRIQINQEFYNKRYISSCCGKSRQSFYFYNDARTAKRVDDSFLVTPDTIIRLIGDMEESSSAFHETGGVHTACLAGATGITISRADIGRHNALDKLYGYALRNHMPLTGKIVTFSGRLSSEVVLKVAKIGAGIVLAKSAPTALALDIAEELNITTVGFARGDSFNIYTHPERVAS